MSLAQVNREYSTGAQPILSKSLSVPVLSGTQSSTRCLSHWENVRTVPEPNFCRPDATIHPWERPATLPTGHTVPGNHESPLA